MAVSSRWDAVILQILTQFKAHVPVFTARYRFCLHNFCTGFYSLEDTYL